ncbi:MAG: hypothetical protein ACK5JD_05305 [Mangrovibacterium sp.]
MERKKSFESIQNFINTERDNQWLNYPITILVVLIPSLLISFCLNVGIVFNKYKISFIKLFGVALKAQLIFALSYLMLITLKTTGVVRFSYATVNNNYDYQSVLAVINHKTLPYWLIYPLQCICIAEIFHILLLSLGIKYLLQLKYSKAILFVLLWYALDYSSGLF